jgi:hypothetical protein
MPPVSISRSEHLNCPGCGAGVADKTSICPRCDYIIDDSFLGSNPAQPAKPPPRGRSLTPTEDMEVPERPRSSKPKPKPPPSGRTGPKRPAQPAPSEPEPWLEQPYEKPEAEADWHIRPAPPPEPTPHFQSPNVISPEQELASIRDFISNLGSADKIAFTGAALTILVSFFPWKDTVAEGEVLGLMSLGVLTTLMALVTIGAIAVRVQRAFPQMNAMYPWLVQLATNCAAIVWCLIFIKLSWNGTKVHSVEGNTLKPISTPAMGVFLGIITSILSLGGTLMGLKDKRV